MHWRRRCRIDYLFRAGTTTMTPPRRYGPKRWAPSSKSDNLICRDERTLAEKHRVVYTRKYKQDSSERDGCLFYIESRTRRGGFVFVRAKRRTPSTLTLDVLNAHKLETRIESPRVCVSVCVCQGMCREGVCVCAFVCRGGGAISSRISPGNCLLKNNRWPN